MNRSLATCLLVALALALPACKKEGQPGSCHRQQQSACVSFDGAHAAAGKRMCGAGRWIDGAMSCPTAGRLGTCTRENGTIVEYLYEGEPNHYTRGLARQVCETAAGVFQGP